VSAPDVWRLNQSDGIQALGSLIDLFEAQARRTPSRVAASLIGQADHLTYSALSEQSERLAHRLSASGAGPGSIVGVHLERTPKYLTAILAVLKCGSAFMPLDPKYPRGRLEFMVQDSGAKLLITDSRLAGNIKTNSSQMVLLDREEPAIESEVQRNPAPVSSPENLAYVIYTSGSTGKPKGVLCPQLGLLNRLEWMSNVFPYEPGEIACQIVPLSFVDSVYEIFGPLLQGVELRMIPEQVARGSPLELMREIERNRISRIIVVPTVLAHWLDCIASLNRSAFPLKYCFVSGEVFLASLAKRFRELLPKTRLINFYGSSELCHHATWFEIADTSGKTVPIGRPIAATGAYVLDSSRNRVANGEAGELYMGGPGIARGYLNQPELTAERFVENPFGAPGSRLFKTADLCRVLEDGNLDYLGRIDQQLKIHGCLVEPAEVEAALKSHAGVKDTLAGAREDGGGEKKLVAWVILRQQGTLTAAELRHFMEDILPAHLVPSQFMFVTDFPRLPNNKANRRELPSPFQLQNARRPAINRPREGTERRLANLWQELLKRESLDRDEEFFDLGGDSLQAVRLIAMIEERFGVMIPLHTLLESPTIAQLAVAIEEQRSSIYPRYIVPIQPFGSRVRFFCFGAGPALKPLARQLGADQPFFGISLDEEDVSGWDHGTPLGEMVRRMLPSLREFQPDGPYCLGGYSMHGLFAFEAALQLQQQTQQVAALILMDSYLPAAARDRCPVWMRAGSHLSSLGNRVAKRDAQLLLRHLKSASSQAGSYLSRRVRKTEAYAAAAGRDGEPALADLLRAAEATFMPRSYRGCITLIEARDQLLGGSAGARFGWKHLSGAQVETRSVPGDHNTMLQHPNVDVLAHEIAACLDAAQVNHAPRTTRVI